MSLINKFTIGFQMERVRRRSVFENNNATINFNLNREDGNRQALSQELVEILINFGFDLNQIMSAHKVYKFSNVDEACYILMKDVDTGKYNHRFFKPENQEYNSYSNLSSNVCTICGGTPSDHDDFELPKLGIYYNSENVLPNTNILNPTNQEAYVTPNNNHSSQLNINRENSTDKLTNLNCVQMNDNLAIAGNNSENVINQNVENVTNKNSKPNSFNNLKNLVKFDNLKIEIPSETLDLFDDPDVCRICFAEKITQNNKAEFACGHKFCRKCVSNHLTTSITNGKVKN